MQASDKRLPVALKILHQGWKKNSKTFVKWLVNTENLEDSGKCLKWIDSIALKSLHNS